ncbi:MAG TPA: ATP-dependent helicase, partial [Actinomycetota bacterium]|nr:ATP-dependent helicase [Actinomycetota bacterium]
MAATEILADLNTEQQRAVGVVRGPLCILAGAGSGKTHTVTRRIANQVTSGAFEASQILAVTFTDKAAGEMRARLATLGVEGVRARTFHSAALAQLRNLSQEFPYQILPSKAVALRQIANTLPKPYKFRPAIDLASEIEWAKNRRLTVEDYPAGLQGHEPPIPVDLMTSVYKRYQQGKRERNMIDFEDLLELTIQLFQADEWVRERFAGRYHSFTVDEYQDVNLLQETLLREWLGERDDLCVVGDDYQSIYGFTGATPEYLLSMPKRFISTTVIRLESNYRSTPQVLDVANRLVPNLGGAEKVLTATRDPGPEPALRMFSNSDAEMAFILSRIRALKEEGVPYEEMAILYRVNFRSEDYEEVLAQAGIPYQVRDGAFLNRSTARQVLGTLARVKSTDVAAEVRKIAERQGYLEEVPDGVGDQELTRQNDLARFIRMAEEFDTGSRTGAEFVADLQSRFGGGEGRGVNLATYHRAKGLEFEAVFLPRLEDGELPFKRSKTDEAIVEERRLFYVGITRAKTHLAITWVNDGRRKASAFVGELREGKAAAGGHLERPPAPRDEVAAAIGKELEVPGGFSGEIIEVTDAGVTIEMEGGVALFVPFGERVTASGKTGPLGPPTADERDSALFEELKAWRSQRAK